MNGYLASIPADDAEHLVIGIWPNHDGTFNIRYTRWSLFADVEYEQGSLPDVGQELLGDRLFQLVIPWAGGQIALSRPV